MPFDAAAVRLLAQAADGSMRDALSLLDQLLAFGGGRVQEEASARDARHDRPDAGAAAGGLPRLRRRRGLLALVAAMDEFSPDYAPGAR